MAKRANDLSGKEWLQNSFSIWRDLKKSKEEKALNHPASYPIALCEKLIKTFSINGSNVLDPFGGVGSTMVAADKCGSTSTSIELSDEYCELAKGRIEDTVKHKFICGDSREVLQTIASDTYDLCITSPPYWDILNMKRTADVKINRNYSSDEVDVGNISDYQTYIDQLLVIFEEVYRVLKPDSYCLINVMDLRKKSEFYPLHSDLAYALKNLGFYFDDLIIWDRQSDYNNMRPLGYPYRFRINKVHEYVLIMHKR